jgi:excinuclease ABC subunit A
MKEKTLSNFLEEDSLCIKNAYEHNLKNISLNIPHNKVVALSGLSGSGKSTLAFEVIFREGQRRYLETFSPYVRQFFEKHKPPKVDNLEGLRPTIAIRQKNSISSPRSTVGTLTSLSELLKDLWSNLAEPVCPVCNINLDKWQPRELAKRITVIINLKTDSQFALACKLKVIGSRKKDLTQAIEQLSVLGISRYFNKREGNFIYAEDILEAPSKYSADELLITLLRINREELEAQTLEDTIAQSFKIGQKTCVLIDLNPKKRTFSEKRKVLKHSFNCYEFSQVAGCTVQEVKILPAKPTLFSYNSPYGACNTCNGFGNILELDLDKVIPDKGKSLEEKAIFCWNTEGTTHEFSNLIKFCQQENIPTDKPWEKLTAVQKDKVLNTKNKFYYGIIPWFKWLETKKYKVHVRVLLSRYRSPRICPDCLGSKINASARAYKIDGLAISDVWKLQLINFREWLKKLKILKANSFDSSRTLKELLVTLETQVDCLIKLGLGYLTPDRQANTLSGGETQRLNLAVALGSSLTSTHFILDEPSVGLHHLDSTVLVKCIEDLKNKGNSVLVIEHNPEILKSADYVIELGPKAGSNGGDITYNGSAVNWQGIDFSPPKLSKREGKSYKNFLEIQQAAANNLKNLSLKIPLNCLVGISGVSGSGKSSLLIETIYNGYLSKDSNLKLPSHIERVTLVDQKSLAKNSRSNIATYTKIWEVIRNLFAQTDEAHKRKLPPSHFSFNRPGGRCNFCEGRGYITEDLQFLSSVETTCPVCLGNRFQSQVLEVKLRDKNINDILNLTVADATNFFHSESTIINTLETLDILGLGHLTLGRSLSDLSGGESQRLKLTPFLQLNCSPNSLMLFDEPTAGLHYKDIESLIELFRLLIEKGASIITIAHCLPLIAATEWLVDIGPVGGVKGGYLEYEGPTAGIMELKSNSTKLALESYLNKFPKKKSFNPKASKIPLLENSSIKIKGARENNLKNINIDIPLNQNVVITGVSGSGKSTIAKDIIFAESQHQFLSCLSPYARQFVNTLSRPNIDSISFLPPALKVAQHTFQPSSLSTVGTLSEVYHYLRLLFSKLGNQYCTKHPEQSVGEGNVLSIFEKIKQFVNKSDNFKVLATIIKNKKGAHQNVFYRAIDLEIDEVRVDGEFGKPSSFIENLATKKNHTIEYVVLNGKLERIADDLVEEALTYAISLGGGNVSIYTKNSGLSFSTDRNCPICGTGYTKLDPEDFSFNSARGRCVKCGGTGQIKDEPCPKCNGSRLNANANSVRIGEHNIGALTKLKINELYRTIINLTNLETSNSLLIIIATELIQRLKTLLDLGLDYLILNQSGQSLSGGELQRIRLATVLGSPLSGLLYIFDEPSIGLHPQDQELVLNKINELQNNHNSLILIDHDPNVILRGERIVEIGPGGGSEGGQVIFNDSIEKFKKQDITPTAKALRNYGKEIGSKNREPREFLTITNGSCNNIKNLNLEIPLNSLVSVVGVSGAGKSSLVHGLIMQKLSERYLVLDSEEKDLRFQAKGEVATSTPLEKLILIDQKPIGGTTRSTPASFLKIFDEIRKIYAGTIEAKTLGWSAGHFSYNTGQGRCPECQGAGYQKIEMSFLPDSEVICPECEGTRYKEEIRQIRFLGLSIDEVLGLSINQAKLHFKNHRKIQYPLKFADELGLGYLVLGQASKSLSGGENQRLKLVSELSKRTLKNQLFILDEPTTGLHMQDIRRLSTALHQMIDKGASVILVEHDVEVILQSDWIVELGPSGGDLGGKVLYSGAGFPTTDTPWGKILACKL